MSESGTEEYPPQLDWFRYFCGFMLYTYGISKLFHLQFDLQSELARQPVGSLSGYQPTHLVLLWLLPELCSSAWPHADSRRNSAPIPENYSSWRAHDASGNGEHPHH